jgi:hypothetical protein
VVIGWFSKDGRGAELPEAEVARAEAYDVAIARHDRRDRLIQQDLIADIVGCACGFPAGRDTGYGYSDW